MTLLGVKMLVKLAMNIRLPLDLPSHFGGQCSKITSICVHGPYNLIVANKNRSCSIGADNRLPTAKMTSTAQSPQAEVLYQIFQGLKNKSQDVRAQSAMDLRRYASLNGYGFHYGS